MAYIQSTTPLDDNKETTGTNNALITPALNSSAGGNEQTTSNPAIPPVQPQQQTQTQAQYIQPTVGPTQQGTGFTNLQSYLDKNQGSSNVLTGLINNALTNPRQSIANASELNTLSKDVSGRTQLLRNLSPTDIGNQGLNLDQYLVQENRTAPTLQTQHVTTPVAPPVVQPPANYYPSMPPPAPVAHEFPRPTIAPLRQDSFYRTENAQQTRELANNRNAVFNPAAQPNYNTNLTFNKNNTPQTFIGQQALAAKSQQGFGRNYSAEDQDARIRQAALTRLSQTYK